MLPIIFTLGRRSGGTYVPTCGHCGQPYPFGKDKSRFQHFRDRHAAFDFCFIGFQVWGGLSLAGWIICTLLYWADLAPFDAEQARKYPDISAGERTIPPTIPQVLKDQWKWVKNTASRAF